MARVGLASKRAFRYGIPSSFAKILGIKRGDLVLAVSRRRDVLEIIPLSNVLEKIGGFREPDLISTPP